MSHSITVRLNKAASAFAAGDSTGFGLSGGVKYYDRESKTEKYTNYEAVVFVSNNSPGQLDYYRNSLVENAIVEISGPKQAIKQFQGQHGPRITIEILEAKLGFIGQGLAPAGNAQQQQQQNQRQSSHPQQGSYNQEQNSHHHQLQGDQQHNYSQQPPAYGNQPRGGFHNQ